MNNKLIAGLILLPLYSGVLHAEGTYSLGIGADYSEGDYGTGDDTTLWAVPIALIYKGERFGWGISVPYLILHSSGNVVVGGAGVIGAGSKTDSTGGGSGPGGGGTSSTTTESGLGDVTLRGSVKLVDEGEVMPWLGLTLKAKIATADEAKFLGTGENDYAAQVEMAKGMVDGYVGYKLLGDTDYVDFNNVAYGALALSHASSADTRYAIEGYVEQAAFSGGKAKREVSLIADHWLDDKKRISGYVLKGFSDASPDWGAGIALKYSM